jgi:ParB family transcriptional regulator, chromosome partitioning protein
VARPGGLGKGLSALIPTSLPSAGTPGSTADEGGDEAGPEGARLAELPIDAIVPNPHQPRVHFDEESLSDLAASIRELGVLQPILVRPGADGGYELLAGERRWRAARRAGLAVVPAVIRMTDDLGSVERALVENLHRQDLTPLEEAAAYQQLIEDFQFTHEQVATRVGKSRSAVSNMLRLLSLPAAIQHLLSDGRLSAGHAKALLGTPDRAFQEQLARRAVAEGWPVRAVEEAVRDRSSGLGGATSERTDATTGQSGQPGDDGGTDDGGVAGETGSRPGGRLRPPGLLELEELLADCLSTRVAVSMGTKRGKLVIEFADLEDLERLYHLMSSGAAAQDHT